MNDLRSQNRSLAPVRELGPQTGEVVTNPTGPRARKRRSGSATEPPADRIPTTPIESTEEPSTADDDAESLSFPVSKGLDSMSVTARSGDEEAADGAAVGSDTSDRVARRAARRAAEADSPATRPSKRREAPAEPEPEVDDEKFSWSFKYDEEDDQPEELQAKSPLLSRAFRSSVG